MNNIFKISLISCVAAGSFLLTNACGTASNNSQVKGPAVAGSDCRDQVVGPIAGTNTYYKFVAVTYPDNPSANNKGKISSCYYSSKQAALDSVRASCNQGGTATCASESAWELTAMPFTFAGSGQVVELPPPPGGGCYKKWSNVITNQCPNLTKEVCTKDWPYYNACGWANPPPAPPKPMITDPGIYRTNGKIYYAAASKHYCVYPSMEFFKKKGSPAYTEIVTNPAEYLINDGDCAFPEGHFRVGETINYSNGIDAYCNIKSYADYEKIGKPAYWQSPANPQKMRFDGACNI